MAPEPARAVVSIGPAVLPSVAAAHLVSPLAVREQGGAAADERPGAFPLGQGGDGGGTADVSADPPGVLSAPASRLRGRGQTEGKAACRHDGGQECGCNTYSHCVLPVQPWLQLHRRTARP